MAGRVHSGFKPWEVQAGAIEEADAPKSQLQALPSSDGIVDDVLQVVHASAAHAASVRFNSNSLDSRIASASVVGVTGSRLSIGSTRFPISTEQTKALTLLEPTRDMLAGAWGGISSGTPTLISAPAGCGTSHTLKWLLDCTRTVHRSLSITRMTSVDALVGAQRPGLKDGSWTVPDGPLTQCIREGGVFLAEDIGQADKDVLSLLRRVAAGGKLFHHPVSGRVLKVHPDFKLLMSVDSTRKAPSAFRDLCNVVHVSPYTQSEHRRLLVEKHGLQPALATTAAAFHASVLEKGVNFGRQFNLGWPLLDRIGERLSNIDAPTEQHLADAIDTIYRARLSCADALASLSDAAANVGLPPPNEIVSQVSSDPRFRNIDSQRDALHHAESALVAHESVLLRSPGQSGSTRIVDELARRREQPIATVVCHPGTDAQSLLELPKFNPDGSVLFIPGVISDALVDGKMLYFDHFDHLPPEQQSALLRLRAMKTLSIQDPKSGKMIERAVHERSAIVFSVTDGSHRTRKPVPGRDRSRTTEVFFDRPSLPELMQILPDSMPATFVDAIRCTAEALLEAQPDTQLFKMQRFLDFSNAAQLMKQHVGLGPALAKAARMVFDTGDVALLHYLEEGCPDSEEAFETLGAAVRGADPKGLAGDSLQTAPPEATTPLWMRIIGVTPREVDERVGKTGYRLVPSMDAALEPLAIAYTLKRPVLVVGPASSGKTVLGSVWAAIVEKPKVRLNFSASTESRDLKGGLGPVNTEGRTEFRYIPGPEMTAASAEAVLIADEWNLNSDAQVALKTWLDYRRRADDPESRISQEIGTSFLFAAENPVGTRGRQAHPPVISDCMFHITHEAKPIEEKIDIVASQCDLEIENVSAIAHVFDDIEVYIAQEKMKGSVAFSSAVAPISCTERDMLQTARLVEHLFERDGVTADDKRACILGRELCRHFRDIILDDVEREALRSMVESRLRETLNLSEKQAKQFAVQFPKVPTAPHVESIDIDGAAKSFVVVGAARIPVRVRHPDPDAVTVTIDGVPTEMMRIDGALYPTMESFIPKVIEGFEPTREQLQHMESNALAIEMDQPFASVGKTGTGKTILLAHLAALAEQPFLEQQFHADMTIEDISGGDALTDDGSVVFRHPPLNIAAMKGGWFNGDELLTLQNELREALNPTTEGSELQIPSRPRRVLKRRPAEGETGWHPDFRIMFTTNGGDIRESDFSAPEASRLRITGLRESRNYDDLLKIAQRLHGPTADASSDAVPAKLGRLADGRELETLTKLFGGLRDLQLASEEDSISPLTTRIFASFLALYVHKRQSCDVAEATMRAAELALLSKLGSTLQRDALAAITSAVGEGRIGKGDADLPRLTADTLWFGNTGVSLGELTPWPMDNKRFPMTRSRLADMSLIADSVALGAGRPISCTDDDNGEALEVLREFGRLSGRRVTVVSLPPNADIDGLIESWQLTDDPEIKGGFIPELREIGRAVEAGDLLVLRGCGNIPSAKLERLNSLFDGRRILRRPRSGEWLRARPEGRVILMRRPGAPYHYSPALEGRVIEPQLSTRKRASTEAVLRERAAELAALVHKRTGISETLSQRLAVFHTYLNVVLRDGAFASGRTIGSLLNRDAEAAGRRIKVLQERGAIDDDLEGLAHVVMSVYGERFDAPTDRLLLKNILSNADCFGCDGGEVQLAETLTPSHHLMRFGEWAAPRDERGVRPNVPGPEAILPEPLPIALAQAHQRVFAALQFREPVHLHGDAFVAAATINSVARLTTSPVFEIEGNEELSEAYLFGGLVQKDGGGFERYEGMIWRAQREGATLVLKHASRIPPAVLTKLEEMAATGNVQRVVNGELDVQPLAFRMFLQTSRGDPSLTPRLGSLCSRVRCAAITDATELRSLMRHILIGVPGGREIADAMASFGKAATKALENETLYGRQAVRFDSGRLLRSVEQMAKRFKAGGAKLENIIADTLVRMYVRPLNGLEAAKVIEELIVGVGAALGSEQGALRAEMPDPVDIVATPQLSSLKRDYDVIEPAFTDALLGALAAFASSVDPSAPAQGVGACVQALCEVSLFPYKIAQGLRSLRKVLDAGSQEKVESALTRLKSALKQAQKRETSVLEPALDFVRGARMWDLEHRFDLLGRYSEVFALLRAPGTPGGEEHIEALKTVYERFDSAAALETVRSTRASVDTAIRAFRTRQGDSDIALDAKFRKVLEAWDSVTTTPIFKNHHLLRTELTDLNGRLRGINQGGSETGSESVEWQGLVEAIGTAGEILGGVRIAEQSADLRRDLARHAADTTDLVGSLRSAIDRGRVLHEANERRTLLTRSRQRVCRATEGAQFLKLRPDDISVERPKAATEAALRSQASVLAQPIADAEVRKARARLYAKMQTISENADAPDAANFFDNYDLGSGDLGIKHSQSVANTTVGTGTRVIEAMQTGLAELTQLYNETLARGTETIFEEKRGQERRRVADEHQRSVRARSKALVSSVRRSARDLLADITELDKELGLLHDAPGLHASVSKARKELRVAITRAEDWGAQVGEFVTSGWNALVEVVSFGMVTADNQVSSPQLDLDAARDTAADTLVQILDHIDGELEKLPDGGEMVVLQARTTQLSDSLLFSRDLGELASRFAALKTIATDEQAVETRRALDMLLGRMSSDRDARELLMRVAAFAESARSLSATVATAEGVAVDIEPVLESVMNTATLVRALPPSVDDNRPGRRALTLSMKRIDELQSARLELYMDTNAKQQVEHEIGPLLLMREEMAQLAECMRRVDNRSGELVTQEAEVGAMLARLGERHDSAQSELNIISAALDSGANGSGAWTSPASTPARTRRAAEQALESVARLSRTADGQRSHTRASQLVSIGIDFASFTRHNSPQSATKSVSEAPPIDDMQAERINGSLHALMLQSENLSVAHNEASQAVLSLLNESEEIVAGQALALGADKMSALATTLEHIADAAGQPYRGLQADLSKSFAALRGIAKSLDSMERVPSGVGNHLWSAVAAGRELAATLDRDALAYNALRWASDALDAVNLAQGDVQALIDHVQKNMGRGIATVLEELDSQVSELSLRTDPLGSGQRAQLLIHMADRLDVQAMAMHADGDSAKAKQIVEAAIETAAQQARLSGQRDGDSGYETVLECFLRLGYAVADSPATEEKQVALFDKLSAGVETLAFGSMRDARDEEYGSDGNLVAALIDQTQQFWAAASASVRKSASDLDAALGSLRQMYHHKTIENLHERFLSCVQTTWAPVQKSHFELQGAVEQLAHWDEKAPTSSLEDLATTVMESIVSASDSISGPSIAVLAADVGVLNDTLRGLSLSGAAHDVIIDLLDELRPISVSLGRVSLEPDVPDRYRHIVDVMNELFSALPSSVTPGAISRLEKRLNLVEELAAAPRDRVGTLLEGVESDFAPRPQRTGHTANTDFGDETFLSTVQGDMAFGSSFSGAGAYESNPSRYSTGGLSSTSPAQQTPGHEEWAEKPDDGAGNSPAAEASDSLGDIHRGKLGDGVITERSDVIAPLVTSDEQINALREAMETEIAAIRAAALEAAGDGRELNDFESFIAQNNDLVERLAQVLRQFPSTEIVICVDQSGSADESYNGTRIIDQERAAAALLMAAVMRGESNCAVIGFDDYVFDPYKHMALPLDNDSANVVYKDLDATYGMTDLVAPIDAAIGQFTDKANQKLIVMCTDAYVRGHREVRRKIATARKSGIGVAVLGFGDAEHVEMVAGEHGKHVRSYTEIPKVVGDLFAKAIVENGGAFRGTVKSQVQGVGISDSQAPILAADTQEPTPLTENFGTPLLSHYAPAQVYATEGPRRELHSLVDSARYANALRKLEDQQQEAVRTPEYRRNMLAVNRLREKHERQGVIESLRDAVGATLPRGGGVEWERKQTSGPLLDEGQLPMYIAGLKQGVPVVRIFKRKTRRSDIKAKVVLGIDESSSMGNDVKMRANLEALFAYGDALQELDPDIEISVIGFSDHVRLHAGFEQTWGPELKAHILNQVSGSHDATDNERGGAEALGLLNLVGADVGQVVNFSDGQGMPGAQSWMQQTSQDGYSSLTVGIGPDCSGVRQFGDYGLHAVDIAEFIQKIATSGVRSWELAGRIAT